MKNLYYLLTLLMFTTHLGYGQQWVEPGYSYDSLLNVRYGTALDFSGETDSLHMDIYLPDCSEATTAAGRPLLMWIHGGAFLEGDKNDVSIQALCKAFARRGYVTASIDYRLGFVSDDRNWQCNYPNYGCVFATDSSEWARAYYRAVQDGKGALRYLLNRYEEYGIDPENVFVAGESAGSFVALGVGLMDTPGERPPQTFEIDSAPIPHPNTLGCTYNFGKVFVGDSIERPDLGGIDGDIEPTSQAFTIKGIGNMYGAMLSNLLEDIPGGKPKPAIYSFHQPCDLVVPIDSNYVYWGLNWCFTNGYNCNAIANNEIMLYGSRQFSRWNSTNDHGYAIQDEFTAISFPFNFLFFPRNCLDQVNNPCHAYDDKALRENNLAVFFSNLISTDPICEPATTSSRKAIEDVDLSVYPNPAGNFVTLGGLGEWQFNKVELFDLRGRKLLQRGHLQAQNFTVDVSAYPPGLYLFHVTDAHGERNVVKFIKR